MIAPQLLVVDPLKEFRRRQIKIPSTMRSQTPSGVLKLHEEIDINLMKEIAIILFACADDSASVFNNREDAIIRCDEICHHGKWGPTVHVVLHSKIQRPRLCFHHQCPNQKIGGTKKGIVNYEIERSEDSDFAKRKKNH